MKRQIEIDINPTPQELAEVFCNMYEEEQVEFFNEIAKITKTWNSPFCMQLQAIVDTNKLTPHAKLIMRQIGEYAEIG